MYKIYVSKTRKFLMNEEELNRYKHGYFFLCMGKQKLILKFIWRGKISRMGNITLKNHVGGCLTNFKTQYKAA